MTVASSESLSSLLSKREIPLDDGQRLRLDPQRFAFVAALLGEGGFACSLEEGALQLTAESPQLVRALSRALRPQLLCLDIDGCLIDTETSFDTVVKTMVRRHLQKDVTDAEILAIRREGGFNDDNVLVYEIIRRAGGNLALADVLPEFRDLYIGTVQEPGLYRSEELIVTQPLLQRLCKDFHVALVTGRNREEAALALELLSLPASVPVYTVDDVAVGKPDPEGILAAAARFDAQSVWMVGDNVDDIHAARNAGAVAIGVGRYREALIEAGAHIVLDDINQLGALL